MAAVGHRRNLAFVVRDSYAPAGTGCDIVDVEAAHRPTIKVQSDGTGSLRRNSGDVNMIGIRHETRHRAASKQDGSAACEIDLLVSLAIRRQPDIAALLQNTFDDADHAPTAMIVHRRPLTWKPDDRV